jgi:hypothetical protein
MDHLSRSLSLQNESLSGQFVFAAGKVTIFLVKLYASAGGFIYQRHFLDSGVRIRPGIMVIICRVKMTHVLNFIHINCGHHFREWHKDIKPIDN